MSTDSKKMIFRYFVMLAVLLNVGFNYLYNYLPVMHKSVGEVSAEYKNLFTPASYAFSIWGLIYLAFIVYGVYQLLPKTRDKILYNRLAGPMIFTNLLSIAWIITDTTNMIGLSVVIMGAILINAITMFTLVRSRIRDCEYTPWLTTPFSLYAGWITVASIANITQWLVALGWNQSLDLQRISAIVLIVISAGIAVTVSYKHRDWIYPAVISWALIAIGIADKTEEFITGITSLIAGVLVGTWSAGYAVYRIRLYTTNPMSTN